MNTRPLPYGAARDDGYHIAPGLFTWWLAGMTVALVATVIAITSTAGMPLGFTVASLVATGDVVHLE